MYDVLYIYIYTITTLVRVYYIYTSITRLVVLEWYAYNQASTTVRGVVDKQR